MSALDFNNFDFYCNREIEEWTKLFGGTEPLLTDPATVESVMNTTLYLTPPSSPDVSLEALLAQSEFCVQSMETSDVTSPVSEPLETKLEQSSRPRGRAAAEDGDPRRVYKCPERGCKSTHLRPEHLSRHMERHRRRVHHKCPECPKTYTRRDNMLKHLKEKHESKHC